MLNIIISIATFNRPAGLVTVLDGIESQVILDQYNVSIVITDNSFEGNANRYINNRKTSYRWNLVYLHESTTGISYARNAGLMYALDHNYDYLIFIDDDECPDTAWLNELISVCDETGAPAVVGAVKPRFDEPPPWWIPKAGYFHSSDQADRTPVPNGYTTNAIVSVSVVRDLNLRFDPKYALTGGEDTLFFKKIQKGSGEILFARYAISYEYIVPARARLQALMKYWYRTGNTKGILRITGNENAGLQKVKIIFSGLARIIIGFVMSLVTFPAIIFKQVHTFRFIRILCRGLGYFMSVFGIEYQEYKNHSR